MAETKAERSQNRGAEDAGTHPHPSNGGEPPLHGKTGCGHLGEGLLGDEAQVPQQFEIGVGFGVIGGKEFVAVEDGVRAGKETQRLRFPRQP